GVAAAEVVMGRAAAGRRPVAAGPVLMIGATFHEAIDMLVRVLAKHADVVTAGNDVADVLDDAIGNEQLAPLVPVEAPRVRRAVGIDFPVVPHRMIAPDAAVDDLSPFLRRARF